MHHLRKPSNTLLLVLILVFFFLKGLLFITLIPPWDAPDERGHFAYVEYLVNKKSLPEKMTPFMDKNLWNDSSIPSKISLSIHNNVQKAHELFKRSTYAPQYISPNISASPPLYYLSLVPFYLVSLLFPSYWTLIFLRVGSLLLGLGSICVVYKLSQLLLEKQSKTPLLISFLFSIQPMFVFMSSVINNDSMVILFFLMFSYFMIKVVQTKKPTYLPQLTLLALLTGLSTLVKPQLLITLPVLFILFVYMRIRPYSKLVSIYFLALIFPILWYFPKMLHEGMGTFTYAIKSQHNPQPFWMYFYQFVKDKQPVGIFMSFWGMFGSLDIIMPKWVYILPIIPLFVSFCGYLKLFKKKFRVILQNPSPLLFFYFSSLLYTLFIFMYDILGFTSVGQFSIQGRYLLPVLPALLIFIVKGIQMYSSKLRYIFIRLLLVVFLMLQLEMYTTISLNYYHQLTLLSPMIFFLNK